MRALRFHGRRDVRLDEVPEPAPLADQVARVRGRGHAAAAPTALLYREVAVVGSLACTTADFERAVRIGEDRVRTITVDEAADWFARLAGDIGDDVEVLVRPR
ncbi:hypothetical protein ACFWQL_09910 [Amycolatopsis thermoflava]|uniref:hypothetical protein n=1 Tax=Amycolatopsis thermoflava TaxID=84480 RepID=UPI00365F2A98